MDNKTKKAITALLKQKSKLDLGKSLNDRIWHTQLRSYVAAYFSENSNEYNFLSQKYFHVDEYDSDGPVSQSRQQADLKVKIAQAKEFIDNCIETLTQHGVYKSPKINWVSDYSNLKIVLAVIAIFSAGFGTYRIIEEIKSPSAPANSAPAKMLNTDSSGKVDQKVYKKPIADSN